LLYAPKTTPVSDSLEILCHFAFMQGERNSTKSLDDTAPHSVLIALDNVFAVGDKTCGLPAVEGTYRLDSLNQ
jgi:hypothetical protein